MEFIKIILNISGLLFILAGNLAIASAVFRYTILYHYCRASREHYILGAGYQIIGCLFGINKENWEKFYRLEKGTLSEDEEKKIEDPNLSLKGAVYLILGTIIVIIAFFV